MVICTEISNGIRDPGSDLTDLAMSYKFMIIASLCLLGSNNEMQRERCQWGEERDHSSACVEEFCITIVFLTGRPGYNDPTNLAALI